MDAIVLDGDQRSALAVTRSLGRKGIKVIVGAEKCPSLASRSRYCAESFIYPTPYKDPDGFLQAVINFTLKSRKAMLFPITDVTLTEILPNRLKIPETVSIPFAEYDKYLQVTDKVRLFRLGRELKVSIPTTFLSTDFDTPEDMIKVVAKSVFPVVIKPSFSKIRTGEGWIDAKVLYATSEMELRNILSLEIFKSFPFIIQKRVNGPGVGVFLLMKNGEIIAKFAHRRIREKPPSGGVSVLCESIDPPPEAMETSVRILKKLDWTGVAMVEFKIDQEQNLAKLLEINARFWGSLQLAISSGVDFPYWLFQIANGNNIKVPDGYKVGVKSRWELGDLDHILLRFLKSPSELNLSPNHQGRLSLLGDFILDFFRSSVKNEIYQKDDMKPFYYESKAYFKHLFYK